MNELPPDLLEVIAAQQMRTTGTNLLQLAQVSQGFMSAVRHVRDDNIVLQDLHSPKKKHLFETNLKLNRIHDLTVLLYGLDVYAADSGIQFLVLRKLIQLQPTRIRSALLSCLQGEDTLNPDPIAEAFARLHNLAQLFFQLRVYANDSQVQHALLKTLIRVDPTLIRDTLLTYMKAGDRRDTNFIADMDFIIEALDVYEFDHVVENALVENLTQMLPSSHENKPYNLEKLWTLGVFHKLAAILLRTHVFARMRPHVSRPVCRMFVQICHCSPYYIGANVVEKYLRHENMAEKMCVIFKKYESDNYSYTDDYSDFLKTVCTTRTQFNEMDSYIKNKVS